MSRCFSEFISDPFVQSGQTGHFPSPFYHYFGVTAFCSTIYEGRSKSSRKSVIIFLFCKSAELNYYSYIGKHDLYLYSKFCCSGMNTMLTVVAMETVHHDYRPTFVHVCKKSMFNDDVAFDSLPCFFHQTFYEQSSIMFAVSK